MGVRERNCCTRFFYFFFDLLTFPHLQKKACDFCLYVIYFLPEARFGGFVFSFASAGAVWVEDFPHLFFLICWRVFLFLTPQSCLSLFFLNRKAALGLEKQRARRREHVMHFVCCLFLRFSFFLCFLVQRGNKKKRKTRDFSFPPLPVSGQAEFTPYERSRMTFLVMV